MLGDEQVEVEERKKASTSSKKDSSLSFPLSLSLLIVSAQLSRFLERDLFAVDRVEECIGSGRRLLRQLVHGAKRERRGEKKKLF